ncbi:hypothetical protein [Thioclava electrotropha]|uniref:Uncharacterized protein n=1 Tax=Thioclava electrotropha TaxID=1549850 RepID=A0ABX6YPI1_9RHOB|nr:hypothetical protein [Thioclava electrotropha]QPZ89705.1 hypothetical protein AKL02_001590 [Thioclava electrotropha]
MSIRMVVADWIASGLIEELEAEADFAWEALSNDTMAKQAADYRVALEAIIAEPHRAREIAGEAIGPKCSD